MTEAELNAVEANITSPDGGGDWRMDSADLLHQLVFTDVPRLIAEVRRLRSPWKPASEHPASPGFFMIHWPPHDEALHGFWTGQEWRTSYGSVSTANIAKLQWMPYPELPKETL